MSQPPRRPPPRFFNQPQPPMYPYQRPFQPQSGSQQPPPPPYNMFIPPSPSYNPSYPPGFGPQPQPSLSSSLDEQQQSWSVPPGSSWMETPPPTEQVSMSSYEPGRLVSASLRQHHNFPPQWMRIDETAPPMTEPVTLEESELLRYTQINPSPPSQPPPQTEEEQPTPPTLQGSRGRRRRNRGNRRNRENRRNQPPLQPSDNVIREIQRVSDWGGQRLMRPRFPATFQRNLNLQLLPLMCIDETAPPPQITGPLTSEESQLLQYTQRNTSPLPSPLPSPSPSPPPPQERMLPLRLQGSRLPMWMGRDPPPSQ